MAQGHRAEKRKKPCLYTWQCWAQGRGNFRSGADLLVLVEVDSVAQGHDLKGALEDARAHAGKYGRDEQQRHHHTGINHIHQVQDHFQLVQPTHSLGL